MIIDEKDFFRQATLRICSSLDIQTAMRQSLEYLAHIMPADWMCLNLYERGLGALRTIAMATSSQDVKIGTISPLPQEARDFISGAVPDVRIVNQPDMDPVIRNIQKYHELPESSVIVLLLSIEGKRTGGLLLAARGEDRYSEEHARLLSLLNEPFAIALSNALSHEELIRLKDMLVDDNLYLHQELRRLSGDEIVGSDFGLKGVMEFVRQVAPLNSPVLLLGETGAGKELIANAIHHLSPRRDGPFIIVNSGAIPETLIDSELFGHEKGAFTGAITQKRGRFERANHGTIFLDEIGELPPQAQVRMLRVFQDKEIERVGGSESIAVDIRVIAATHRDLEEMVKANQFREDLWFRLNVFPIKIPPLRERKEDIPALVHHFIGRKSKELRLLKPPTLAHRAIDRLMAYSWPGNVRELENVIERAMILNKDGPLTFDHLVPLSKEHEASFSQAQENETLKLDEVVSRHIQQVLKMARGKVHGTGGAAELLGINPSTLRNRMNQLGIPYGRRRR
ncbi:MAG: sigma 54-interacting transcriptional regulator [Thermodesulfobacteriota bacterium]|jgi:transcriptional regulator with GAF, ATPase, and Fis domain